MTSSRLTGVTRNPIRSAIPPKNSSKLTAHATTRGSGIPSVPKNASVLSIPPNSRGAPCEMKITPSTTRSSARPSSGFTPFSMPSPFRPYNSMIRPPTGSSVWAIFPICTASTDASRRFRIRLRDPVSSGPRHQRESNRVCENPGRNQDDAGEQYKNGIQQALDRGPGPGPSAPAPHSRLAVLHVSPARHRRIPCRAPVRASDRPRANSDPQEQRQLDQRDDREHNMSRISTAGKITAGSGNASAAESSDEDGPNRPLRPHR